MKITRPILFFDIEATGVDTQKDRIVQLGISTLYPDMSRKRWQSLFNPEMPIPPEVTAIHGITDEMVKDAPLFAQHGPMLYAGLRGKDIGVFNGFRLDIPMLDEEFRRCGAKLDLSDTKVIDCFVLFSKKNPRKLEDYIRRYGGREPSGSHEALADAEDTVDGFIGQLAEHDDLRTMSSVDLATYSRFNDGRMADAAGKLYWSDSGDLHYAFGKNRGVKVKDDPGFGRWILSRDFPGSTREVLEKYLNEM